MLKHLTPTNLWVDGSMDGADQTGLLKPRQVII